MRMRSSTDDHPFFYGFIVDPITFWIESHGRNAHCEWHFDVVDFCHRGWIRRNYRPEPVQAHALHFFATSTSHFANSIGVCSAAAWLNSVFCSDFGILDQVPSAFRT